MRLRPMLREVICIEPLIALNASSASLAGGQPGNLSLRFE